MGRPWAVFDLDGTLCDPSHRIEWALRKDFDGFHSRCAEDPPYPAEVRIAQSWFWAGGCVAYITGRTALYRVLTLKWLADHELPRGPVYMRETDDARPTTEMKLAAMRDLEAKMRPMGDTLAFIMEDNQKLVDRWRELGYTCLQPRPSAW